MYSGAIENGKMHGQGRLQYANNDVFEVRLRRAGCSSLAFAASWLQARSKLARAACAGVEQGIWEYGKRHGHGTYTYHDGGKYEGEWVDDQVSFPAQRS